jgi:hypothetical protein
MSPRTREYTKRIMNLTFAQLAAGAGGLTSAVPKTTASAPVPASTGIPPSGFLDGITDTPTVRPGAQRRLDRHPAEPLMLMCLRRRKPCVSRAFQWWRVPGSKTATSGLQNGSRSPKSVNHGESRARIGPF